MRGRCNLLADVQPHGFCNQSWKPASAPPYTRSGDSQGKKSGLDLMCDPSQKAAVATLSLDFPPREREASALICVSHLRPHSLRSNLSLRPVLLGGCDGLAKCC